MTFYEGESLDRNGDENELVLSQQQKERIISNLVRPDCLAMSSYCKNAGRIAPMPNATGSDTC